MLGGGAILSTKILCIQREKSDLDGNLINIGFMVMDTAKSDNRRML